MVVVAIKHSADNDIGMRFRAILTNDSGNSLRLSGSVPLRAHAAQTDSSSFQGVHSISLSKGHLARARDPPVPSLFGTARIFRSADAFKRMIEIVPSDYSGLEFCQGCFSEMGEDVVEAIRYFGSRKKIF